MKKIVILGPVSSKSYFGGVADFDENLQKAIIKLGHECYILTEQKDVDLYKKANTYVIKSLIQGIRKINEIEPDFIIASLGYGKYFLLLHDHAKKAYFIHGFFNRNNYGFFRSILYSYIQKCFAHKSDIVVANSYFTKMINENFFNINIDKVVHLGISDKYIQLLNKKSVYKKQKKSILYSGRLVKAKNVHVLLKAFQILTARDKMYMLTVVGDGPEMKSLINYTIKNKLNIKFVGRVSNEELYKYYQKCEVFVSFNPSEPFGIVFKEALANNCKIVAPYTGGQIETLIVESPDKYRCVDIDSPDCIADSIMDLCKKEIILQPEEYNNLGYERVAKQIFDI